MNEFEGNPVNLRRRTISIELSERMMNRLDALAEEREALVSTVVEDLVVEALKKREDLDVPRFVKGDVVSLRYFLNVGDLVPEVLYGIVENTAESGASSVRVGLSKSSYERISELTNGSVSRFGFWPFKLVERV